MAPRPRASGHRAAGGSSGRGGHHGAAGGGHRAGRIAGIAAGIAGLAAVGGAIGYGVTRGLGRVRTTRGPSVADRESPAELREEDPLGHETRRVDRQLHVVADDGVPLLVEEVGPDDAPLTVVFLHGYCLSMASWTFQRRALGAELATANGSRPVARLVFYDQRGHGDSGRGPAEHATLEQLAGDLRAVLDSRAPRGPVVVIGHSMGGMTIMALAALHPELFGTRIAGAALLSTSSGNLAGLNFGLPEMLTRVRAAVIPLAAYTMRRRPVFAERTRRVAADLVSAVTWSLSFGSADVDPDLARYVDAMIAGTPVDVIGEFYPARAGMDHTGALDPLCRVPTVVLTGDKDRMIPKEHSDLIVERLPESQYVVVPDAGHLVLLEKHEEVTAVLSGLLRRVAADRHLSPKR